MALIGNKYLIKTKELQNGFTLVGTMVVMVISSIILTTLYQLFLSQQRSYLAQDQLAVLQQSLRAGLYLMTREIRSAGFDPELTGNFGFVGDFANDIFDPDINYTVSTNAIAFTTDNNGNGAIDANNDEQVAYQVNNSTLERYSSTRAAWEPVSTNIDALNFVYLNQNGDPLDATNTINDIRGIEVSLLVRTEIHDPYFTDTTIAYQNKQGQNICPACTNDNYRRRLLTVTVHTRNL